MNIYSEYARVAVGITILTLLPKALLGVDVNGDGIEDPTLTVYPEYEPLDAWIGDYSVAINTASSRQYRIESSY